MDLGSPVNIDGGRLRVVPAATSPSTASAVAAPSAVAGPAAAGATVVLLHGAGSGTDTPVLTALADRLTAAGVRVAALEMPYRVAGRRAPDRPARLDAVLTAAVDALGRPEHLGLAGASMGSRVAVRCARAVGARAVLALGFPLQPPGDRPSRADELAGAGVPVLVVQGERDAFGTPPADPARQIAVHIVTGADHSFRVRVRDARTVGEVTDEAAGTGASWLLGRLLDGAAAGG
ncbi:alpha/beta family hydrolase [Frankia sp. EI5c]|uniref:alpha/beta hydrolase family protein n=1 Tax=Frankia sp. EI5c TaxID=683316 RepID=UPI0008257DC4|nr:alpha/beta family hydrolase [Frankia sp. EI5c]